MLVRVYLAIDDSYLRQSINIYLKDKGALVSSLKKRNPLNALSKEPCDVIIGTEERFPQPIEDTIKLISELPDSPLVILLTDSRNEMEKTHLLASGCEAVINSNVSPDMICEAIDTILQKRIDTQTEVIQVRRPLAEPRLSDFVSRSTSMQAFMNIARRVSKSDASLLITGETGVGKERLALAIHAEGKRTGAPFIPINCAALPDNLLESELFGHMQGAFTGATRTRRGAFELAHQGTIFLDEIGDMPLILQAKLLRVLQDKQFIKIGGEKPIKVDVRIMAATNRNLLEEVESGNFRKDLYYRLGVVSLHIPPLRERQEDINELVLSYVDYLSPRIGVSDVFSISDEAMDKLMRYKWPGNVRELINVLERAMLLCENNEISTFDLPDEISGDSSSRPDRGDDIKSENYLGRFKDDKGDILQWKTYRTSVLDRCEEEYLKVILRQTRGNAARAAKLAGMTTRALNQKLSKYDFNRKSFV